MDAYELYLQEKQAGLGKALAAGAALGGLGALAYGTRKAWLPRAARLAGKLRGPVVDEVAQGFEREVHRFHSLMTRKEMEHFADHKEFGPAAREAMRRFDGGTVPREIGGHFPIPHPTTLKAGDFLYHRTTGDRVRVLADTHPVYHQAEVERYGRLSATDFDPETWQVYRYDGKAVADAVARDGLKLKDLR